MKLSKAYHCISHDLLLARLSAYDFDESATTSIANYLSNRYQCVKIKSTFCSYLEVLRDAQQISILEQILFNFFKNDVVFFIQETKIWNFVNDAIIYSCSPNFKEATLKFTNGTHLILN